MDTLISVGVGAAYLWSLYALFFGDAGMIGMTHGFTWTISPSDAAGNLYLEVASGVTMFVLAGRYFEVRSKREAGAALRALLDLGAKDVAVLRDDLVTGSRIEVRMPVEQTCASATSSSCARARRSRRTASSCRARRRSTRRR